MFADFLNQLFGRPPKALGTVENVEYTSAHGSPVSPAPDITGGIRIEMGEGSARPGFSWTMNEAEFEKTFESVFDAIQTEALQTPESKDITFLTPGSFFKDEQVTQTLDSLFNSRFGSLMNSAAMTNTGLVKLAGPAERNISASENEGRFIGHAYHMATMRVPTGMEKELSDMLSEAACIESAYLFGYSEGRESPSLSLGLHVQAGQIESCRGELLENLNGVLRAHLPMAWGASYIFAFEDDGPDGFLESNVKQFPAFYTR